MSCKYGYCWEWISIQSRIYLPGEGIWDILQVSCLNRLANKITWYIQSSTQPWLVTLEEARIPVNLISWVKHRPRQKIILQNNKGSILGEVSGLIRLYKKIGSTGNIVRSLPQNCWEIKLMLLNHVVNPSESGTKLSCPIKIAAPGEETKL